MRTLFISSRLLTWMFLPILLMGFLKVSISSSDALSGKIIVVDAGHGGIDPGANRPDVLEKDINLNIALQVRETLRQQGAKVIMTRDTDTELSGLCDNEKVRGRYRRDLNARLEMVEESDADLFVSIHANTSSKPQKRGAECYYYSKSVEGKRLAEALEQQLQTITNTTQEAASPPFFVLRRNKVPAVLIEVGYITNAEERDLLQSPEYQRRLAEAIAAGICDYYKDSALTTFARILWR